MLNLPVYMSSVIMLGGIIFLVLFAVAPFFLKAMGHNISKTVTVLSLSLAVSMFYLLTSFKQSITQYKLETVQEDFHTNGTLSRLCIVQNKSKEGLVTFAPSDDTYKCWEVDCKEPTIKKCLDQISVFYKKQVSSK